MELNELRQRLNVFAQRITQGRAKSPRLWLCLDTRASPTVSVSLTPVARSLGLSACRPGRELDRHC